MRVFDAAVELFFFNGFPAASMRDIGEMAHVNAATIYHYYPSKKHLLMDVIESTLSDLARVGADAIAHDATADKKLRQLVGAHVRFHCWHAKETTICDRELYSLPVNLRAKAVKLRDSYDALWTDVLQHGRAAGFFAIGDVDLCRLALVSLCSQVSNWFRADGRLSVDEIARSYETFALRIVGIAV